MVVRTMPSTPPSIAASPHNLMRPDNTDAPSLALHLLRMVPIRTIGCITQMDDSYPRVPYAATHRGRPRGAVGLYVSNHLGRAAEITSQPFELRRIYVRSSSCVKHSRHPYPLHLQSSLLPTLPTPFSGVSVMARLLPT